jgi:carbonic anhydrase
MFTTALVTLLGLASACPEGPLHSSEMTPAHLRKRADGADWAYDASYNWGMVNTNYTLCQTGTQQSPIPLEITQGFSVSHIPTFNYSSSAVGELNNWRYGPGWAALPGTNNTLQFDNETLYLAGWHIHSPADHTVAGKRSKSELHLVHKNAAGKERAVVAIRIDPSTRPSAFFSSLPAYPGFTNTTRVPLNVNLNQLINEVNRLSNFWTYSGSLTSPPCTEGLRWFVARDILFVDNEQMRRILGASTYSARDLQEVWLHAVNSA